MRLKTIRFPLLVVSAFLSTAATSGEHGAHVHGKARLDIAAEKGWIYVVFESPAINLVGFEHAPRTPGQRRALEQAIRTLAGADRFLKFGGAGCRQLDAEVTGPPENKEEAAEQGTHTAFRANYQFQCDNLARLDSVAVTLFASFPDIHEIAVQWLTTRGQGAASLTAQNNELQLN